MSIRGGRSGAGAIDRSARSVLLLVPAADPRARRAQRSLLRELSDGRNTLILFFRGESETPIHTCYDPELAARSVLVSAGRGRLRRRSSGSVPGRGDEVADRVETRSDPGDVTGIFLTLDKYLNQWGGGRTPVLVVLVSLTTMLDAVDLRTLTRFVRALTNRAEELDARLVFTALPARHDEETLGVLTGLADVVLEYDGTGDWRRD